MTTTAQPFIVYTRVSSKEQGDSGLGLAAQAHACQKFVEEQGGQVVRLFSEVASGGNDHRPQFLQAIKLARRTGATLLVSKLDRVSRAVHLIANMLAEGVPLKIVEIPNASTLEIHLRAVIAQEERDAASKRTRDSLAVLKRAGVKLGSARPGHWTGRTTKGELMDDKRREGQRNATAAAAAARKAKQDMLLDDVADLIRQTTDLSLRAVCVELEERGVLNGRGQVRWFPQQVKRLRAAVGA